MDNPEIWIALVIVGFLIFGAKRMPDAARGLGRSLRIFKAETKGLMTDEPVVTQPAAVAAPVAAPQPVYATAPVAPAPVATVPVAPVPAPEPVAAPAPVQAVPVAQQPDAQ
jgi:sec-independent protein translocase protein TatA